MEPNESRKGVVAVTTQRDPVRRGRGGCLIDIRVKPASSHSGIRAWAGGRLSVAVHAPPEGGRANREALAVLSAALGVPASRLEVIKGRASREKTLLVRDLDPEQVGARLGYPA